MIQAGVIDTVYTDTGKEFDEFPLSFSSKIKEYIKRFGKERKVFVKCKSSYPVFGSDSGLIRTPSIHLVYYGIAANDIPPVGTAQRFTNLLVSRSLSIIYQALQKIEEEVAYYEREKIEYVQGGFVKILYGGKETLLYSKFPKPTSEGGKRAIAEFSQPFEALTGFLKHLPEEDAMRFCLSLAGKNTNHHCQWCSARKEYTEEYTPEEDASSRSSAATIYDESRDVSKEKSAYED